MDVRSRERLQVAQIVLKALRTQDFRSVVSEANTRDEHVIIPALHDDPMDQFFDDFRSAEGAVYLATVETNGEITILSVSPGHAPRHAAPTSEPCPIYPHTELGMVISYLRATRVPLPIYEAPKSALVKLVDGDELALPGCCK
jgi:hypothetical protein